VRGRFGTILFLVFVVPVSLILTVMSWRVADAFKVETPGDLAADLLVPPVSDGLLGRRILVLFTIDIVCWVVVLSGLWWLFRKFRPSRAKLDD
jgi:hypothetical protein